MNQKPRAKPRVIIMMDGGLVQSVMSDQPVDVLVINYDVEGAPPEDILTNVVQGDGTERSADIRRENPVVSRRRVNNLMKLADTIL